MVQAQAPVPDAVIYTCTDDQGRKITADRPIAQCTGREQRVLNRDGSLRMILPPSLTADERAALEARERAEKEARAAQADAARRDRNLMARYRNEATHQRARESALEPVQLAIRTSDQRLKELAAERKPLMSEAEFYVGRGLPPKLKGLIEANDAAVEAQKATALTQQAELVRINQLYDIELERLRRLWAGAIPGSMGPLPTQLSASAKPATGP